MQRSREAESVRAILDWSFPESWCGCLGDCLAFLEWLVSEQTGHLDNHKQIKTMLKKTGIIFIKTHAHPLGGLYQYMIRTKLNM